MLFGGIFGLNRFYDLNVTGDYYGKSVSIKYKDFQLKDAQNNKVTKELFQGKYSLVTFGYTKCTGVCPVNLHRFKKIAKEFPSKDQNIQFVFVSFDSERDGIKELASFLKLYPNKRLIGLIDDETKGIDLANSFIDQIFIDSREGKESDDYQIDHNGLIYLIGPSGKIELIYSQNKSDHKLIAKDLNRIRERRSI